MEQELASIKKPGDPPERISKEEFEYRIKEIAKCKRDIVYFAEHYYRLINLDKGLHVVKLYDVQKELLRFLVDNNKVIVCSGRQQGKCVFQNTNVVLRHKKTGDEFCTTVSEFYDSIHDIASFFTESSDDMNLLSVDNSSSYLHDQVDRKYEETLYVHNYEILTDDGWKDIKTIGKTIPYQVFELETESHSLSCADTHIVFDDNMDEVFVKDLDTSSLIQTDVGVEKVRKVVATDVVANMYDIQLCDDSNHRYFTNGILSHNSTIYCIYALWYTTFFPEKKIMILANKAQTALELLSRCQLGYEYLPYWLKCACVTISKGAIEFTNKSGIRGFASSSDAARGFSANCVDGNTKVTIRLFHWLVLTLPIKYLKIVKLLNFFQVFR